MANNSATVTAALVRDTFREAFARKIFWGFFGCTTAIILFFIFLMKIDVVEGALATISLFGNESRATDVKTLVRGVHGARVVAGHVVRGELAILVEPRLLLTQRNHNHPRVLQAVSVDQVEVALVRRH